MELTLPRAARRRAERNARKKPEDQRAEAELILRHFMKDEKNRTVAGVREIEKEIKREGYGCPEVDQFIESCVEAAQVEEDKLKKNGK